MKNEFQGGVQFINFPNGSFRSEICSEQLLESERPKADREVEVEDPKPRTQDSRLKNQESSRIKKRF